MAIKIDQGDESKMNMTPMIDVTFLLVTFFMLTLDLTSKEFVPVALPYAYQGVEDIDDPKEKVPKFIINLLPNGDVIFKGQKFELASDDPKKQDAALEYLRQELIQLTANEPTLREDDGASKVPVMIHGDRDAKWQYVQWIMMACANPRIKIYKMQFAVAQPKKEG
jgi:biopolymer transport protein ExbD